MYHLVKELNIEVDERSIYSGKALRMLMREPYNGCAFPLVRTLTFSFAIDGADKHNDSSSHEAEENIREFVQRIKLMVPKLRDIKIWPSDRGTRPEVISSHFGSLVSQLFQLVYRIECDIFYDTDVPMVLQLDRICNLTHIEYVTGNNSNQIIQLAQLNALTLQSLDIKFQTANIADLIRDCNGTYVTYPHLLKLKLIGPSKFTNVQRPVFSGVVPFPILTFLSLQLRYQCDDDTFFRGNAATLQFLEMFLDDTTTSMLVRHNVFTPFSHPNLQCVHVGSLHNYKPNEAMGPIDYMKFMLSIGPNAAVRGIIGYPYWTDSRIGLSLLEKHTFIQVLTIITSPLDLSAVMSLIKSLPLLSDLVTMPPRVGNVLDDITLHELPTYLRTSYASMGERFRCWQLLPFDNEDCFDIVICVLLIALVCPNFDYAAPFHDDRAEFMETMKGVIDLQPFQEHAPRLRRLLFNGY
ncbi:hypothetical protein GGI08_001984 [Coemansia sp. S2]|nr:hypothetical protein GGI08_001984 [Coemansia sp. S2]